METHRADFRSGCVDRAELRRNRTRPCHYPEARAHDGWRRDCDERTGQGVSIYGAAAERCDALTMRAEHYQSSAYEPGWRKPSSRPLAVLRWLATGPSRSRQRLMDSFSRAEAIGGDPRRFSSSLSPVKATMAVLQPCPFLTASPDGAGRAVLERAAEASPSSRRATWAADHCRRSPPQCRAGLHQKRRLTIAQLPAPSTMQTLVSLTDTSSPAK